MAADLGEFPGDETDTHPRPKRRSFAQMGHDNPSPVTASPISAPTRTTPPHTALSLERPILENYMTPSPSNTNTPGMGANRQLGGLDHDIAKFAQSPLARAANHDLPGRSSMANASLDDLAQRLSAYTLNRDIPSSAPVTPPTSNFYDPRSRASTLTESSPPLQALQKDVRVPQHYLTPPSEGQASPANLALSQSLPVSRRNSNTEVMRVGQDLSVIYENGPETFVSSKTSVISSTIYGSDHRKSSGTLSGTWSNTSPEMTFVSGSHGYEDTVEPRSDSISSKHVFGMLKTEDGQFPYLAESNSQQAPLSRGTRHGSTPSWPTAPAPGTRNHASRSSYPEQIDHRVPPVDADYRSTAERTSANPSPHPSMLRTPPKGHSPGRFDLNSNEFVPQGAWGVEGDHLRENSHPRSLGGYYGDSSAAGPYIPTAGYVSPGEYVPHGSYYGGPRGHHQPYDSGYGSRHMDQDGSFEYRSQQFYSRDQPSRGNSRAHKRYGSNDYERLVLSKSRIQDFATKIPDLCRDQNGCRHLQGELSTRDEETIEVIYNGAKPYFPDLMSDPFGNYLCQKLLETCNDAQRTELVKIVAPTIVTISLNQHGTRAVQKLLDHLTLPEQVELVKEALKPEVVLLTKDLNGNHVIQKCLNRLESEDKQFIYDAVARKCVEVATHKHGCCVFQRCIDHANAQQGEQLYAELIKNTIKLSQDQFGNYVLQYILDNDKFNLSPLIRQFQNHVVQLSKAKFSSNVIEKCVRVAAPADREFLISEMVRPGAMAEMIDDNFANYVVQTALDNAGPEQKQQMIAEIMPQLNTIKARSWYKRIMSKIGLNLGPTNGHFEPNRQPFGAGRQYMDDGGMHPRMPSEGRGLPLMHAYPPMHAGERSVDPHLPPPGFMHPPPAVGGHPSDRNGYRAHHQQQHVPQPHAQSPQQHFGNFYPYAPRNSIHHTEYRGNGDY